MPDMATLTVNGKAREVPQGLTLDGLVAELKLDRARVAAEVNREVVRRAKYADTVLKDGDRVEIVTFVGGG